MFSFKMKYIVIEEYYQIQLNKTTLKLCIVSKSH